MLRQKITRGRCSNCYKRHVYALKKAEAFEAIKPAAASERLFSRVVAGRNGCVIWTGTQNPRNGYGQIAYGGKVEYTHRTAYMLAKGEIPEGLVIDHACHNRDLDCPGGNCIHHLCVNPHHLDAVTPSENRIRSPHTKGDLRSLMTHCRNGHEFTPPNTFTRRGRRACRTCRNNYQRKYAARKREASREAL